MTEILVSGDGFSKVPDSKDRWVLANKPGHFVLLTDSFIMLCTKLPKPLSWIPTTTALRARYSLYTDVVLLFFSLFSKTSASARKKNKEPIFSFPTLTPSRWRSINPPRFLFFITRARRTLKRKQRLCEQARPVIYRQFWETVLLRESGKEIW